MGSEFRVGDWLVEPDLNLIIRGDTTVRIEPKVMDVLTYLASHAGEVCPKDKILKAIWADTFVGDEVLAYSISELRKALGDDARKPSIIATIAKRGYRLIAPVSRPRDSASRYEILGELGRGAMGKILLAQDSELGRKVALKFLADEHEGDAASRQRLLREARAAAALDHPYICKIYDTGEFEGRAFIAMEYLEGRTLRERLDDGPLSQQDAVRIACEIAEALEEAHREGFVHRDLKPSNIMLTDHGHAKVMDFGLSKQVAATRDSGSEEKTWTELPPEGPAQGTVPYMSPEQLQGVKVDSRSDIFSFGSLVYEMLSGVHPFRRESPIATAAALAGADPSPLSAQSARISERLERTVGKMLAKKPEERYQTVAALRADLENIRREIDLGLPRARSETASGGGRAPWLPYLAAAPVLVAAAVVVWLFLPSRKTIAPPLQALPLTSWVGSEMAPALSPRGDQVAFVSDREARPRHDLYVMIIGSVAPLRLTSGPGSAWKPAWSPDGREIAFLRETEGRVLQVVAIPALGGRERLLGTLSDTPLRGLDWSPDAKSLAVVEKGPGGGAPAIALISTETGEKLPFTAPPSDVVGDKNPVFSPDGKSLAFVRWYNVQKSEIFVKPRRGGEPRLLLTHEGWVEGMDWMPDSSALVFSSYMMGTTGLWKVSTAGEVTQLSFGQNAAELSITPSGGRLAFSQQFSDANIWRAYGPAATERGAPHRLIASTREDWAPQYSPDGMRIALTSDRSGINQTWLCNSEGADCSLLATEGITILPRWSPDGRMIAFGREAAGNLDVYVIETAGGFPRRLTSAAAADIPWSWSRNGLWVYYSSAAGGEYQVWKVPAAGGEPHRITANGGTYPRESVDSRFLYYYKAGSDSAGIWRLPISGGPEELVFEKRGLSPYGFDLWKQSLVYVVQDRERGTAIERFDLESGQVEKLADLDAGSRIGRISVSPDGRWILFTQNEGRPGDLILVENFGGLPAAASRSR